MRSNEEHRIQVAIASYLDIALPDDCIWWAVPNGGNRNPVTGSILKKEGVKAGVPDITLIANGVPYGLEVKTQRGTLQKTQKAFHEAAMKAGMKCFVVRSVMGVIDLLPALGINVRGK